MMTNPSTRNRIWIKAWSAGMLLGLLFVMPSWGQNAEPAASASLYVTGGQWFQTESGEFAANPGILIEEGRIVSIAAKETVPDSIPTLKLEPNQYIMPGFVDCHAHYNVRLLDERREEFTVIPIQYLANGVTVTFSCGEYDPEGMMQLRQDIAAGKKIGPHLLTSGPYFGIARRPWHADPQRVREEVDFWAEKGVGGFKAKLIDMDCLEALVDQAHKHGLTVTGHLDSGFRNSVNPASAIDAGIDRIEHFLGGDGMSSDRPAYSTLAAITADMPEFRAVVNKFVETGTVFDCTITAYGYGSDDEVYEHWYDESSICTPWVLEEIERRRENQPPRSMERFIKIFEAKRQTIDDFFEAGGTITMGTDHVCDGRYLPGFSCHREMHVLNAAGIPAADVLRIATINGARALGIDDDFGSIEAGKWGDLAIVEGNPLDDIRNTRNVRYVVRAGRVHRSHELLDRIQGQLGPQDETEADQW